MGCVISPIAGVDISDVKFESDCCVFSLYYLDSSGTKQYKSTIDLNSASIETLGNGDVRFRDNTKSLIFNQETLTALGLTANNLHQFIIDCKCSQTQTDEKMDAEYFEACLNQTKVLFEICLSSNGDKEYKGSDGSIFTDYSQIWAAGYTTECDETNIVYTESVSSPATSVTPPDGYKFYLYDVDTSGGDFDLNTFNTTTLSEGAIISFRKISTDNNKIIDTNASHVYRRLEITTMIWSGSVLTVI